MPLWNLSRKVTARSTRYANLTFASNEFAPATLWKTAKKSPLTIQCICIWKLLLIQPFGHCRSVLVVDISFEDPNVPSLTSNASCFIECATEFHPFLRPLSVINLQGRNSDTFTLDKEHSLSIEMKPLVRGYLPIPEVRLMKYQTSCKVEANKGL